MSEIGHSSYLVNVRFMHLIKLLECMIERLSCDNDANTLADKVVSLGIIGDEHKDTLSVLIKLAIDISECPQVAGTESSTLLKDIDTAVCADIFVHTCCMINLSKQNTLSCYSMLYSTFCTHAGRPLSELEKLYKIIAVIGNELRLLC